MTMRSATHVIQVNSVEVFHSFIRRHESRRGRLQR